SRTGRGRVTSCASSPAGGSPGKRRASWPSACSPARRSASSTSTEVAMGNWDKPPPRRAHTPSPQISGFGNPPASGSRPGSGSSGTIPRVPPSDANPRQRNAPGPTDRALVTIVCEAGSDILEPTHQFLTAYAGSRVRPHVAPRLSVAVYELLANAL